jgi:hypothetical protein
MRQPRANINAASSRSLTSASAADFALCRIILDQQRFRDDRVHPKACWPRSPAGAGHKTCAHRCFRSFLEPQLYFSLKQNHQ